ncbi:SGNH/GDSL hydrolase family protein [Mucilaginibacter agri]|uniref:Twin-arginine translocation signal domain-containing protein n=1 Tax=Mucilaginibacter agri TaxID=2695265 RepID=A0A966DSJ8_9SPHI|nr:SGNH/GDSL hydrolase family protein [Mucilaginibacter agri]NCD69685.1 twin-arginine translocation signal domain-containing protein [Mucilaginibacter agri]
MNSRRDFITKAATATVAAVTIPGIINTALAASTSGKKKISIDTGNVILFQGDSITDWGRDRKQTAPNTSAMLGGGYAMLAASGLLYKYAGKNLQVYNKGISGNKVFQLADRWDDDCLNLKPNVLSILIGVNDFWHTLNGSYKGTIENYTTDYKKLLDRTKQALPDLKLIIGEPFAVKGVKAVDDKWYPAFDEYRASAKAIAEQYDAVWIPYQSIFDKALETAPGSYWTTDGVHPSVAGSQLMAHAWLETVK